ncbi:hypothetical protein [Tenacibaculum amylolyticum]|uniref:hypothetical protein n=1 Tax=Tenacibaculum amylolyticum TaxID=104269 RepID=UPI00389613D9
MKKLLLLTFFFVISFSALCQNNSQSLFYTSFDNTIGQSNTPLSYGTIFKETYRKRFKDNHNFFLNNQFNKGDILYRGEPYYNVQLKYDIVDDFVVLKITNQKQAISIVPDKELIKTFRIGNFKFVNTNTELGFLEEVALQDNFTVYKKHQKTSKENNDRDYRYHTFKKKKEEYLLFYQKKYYSINSKRDFTKIFPNQKKTITKFFKTNRFLLKNDYKNFVVKLMKQLQA